MPVFPAPLAVAAFASLALGPGHLRTADLVIICVYLLGITAFGLSFRAKDKGMGAAEASKATPDRSLKGYFLAGNTIPWWAIALSVVSAETSTLTVVSIPGVAFAGNFGFLQVVLGYLVGRVVVAVLFLPRYFAGEMLTAYQLIDRRFGGFLHKVTAGLFLLTRAAAEGIRVFAVSIVVGIAVGTGDVASIALISALTLLYTFEGGLAAVIWTDVAQMAIYVGGTLVALLTLGHHVAGGWPAIAHTASAAGKFHLFSFALNLTQSYTFWAGLLGGTFLTMASHGTDQLMVQRLLAARNLRESQWALLSSGVVIFAQFAFFLLIGAGLWVFYGQRLGPHAAAAFRSTDYIFPTFIVREMPVGVAGLLVAAILAAAMSNLSAALNSLSSTTVVDFYMDARPQATTRERMLLSKASTAFWAVVLFAVAIYSVRAGGKGHVVEIGLSIAAVAYGCLLGVFLLGTLTRFATERGTAVGMVCGFALNLWLWQGRFPVHLGPLLIPKIAFTWFVLIGAAVTFATGAAASILLRSIVLRRPSSAAATPVLLAALILVGLSSRSVAEGWAVRPGPQQTPNPAGPRTSPRTPDAATKAPAKPQPQVDPVPTADFSQVSSLLNEAIAQGKLPGAVAVVGHGGQIVLHQAYGNRKLAGEPGLDGQPSPAEPMTEDTIFDMASLTKCIVTATAIGQLYEQKKLSFDAPVEQYLPAFNPPVNGKTDPQRAQVTVRLLLTHFSGEAPDVDLKDPWGLAPPDKAEGLRRALGTPLQTVPGTKFVYSDINFILLGALVEKLSGESLARYARAHIFIPLGMHDTSYLPIDKPCGSEKNVPFPSRPFFQTNPANQTGETRVRICEDEGREWDADNTLKIAPTAHDDEGTAQNNPDFGKLLRGTVHDPTTRRMGGVAGHAGVFSTAHDMSLFAQALLDRLAGRPSKFPLKRLTLEFLTTPEQPGHTPFQVGQAYRANLAAIDHGDKAASGNPALLDPNFPAIKGQVLRGFGWDIDSGYSKPRGRVFPIGSFGHTGFTGTSLWLDPGSDTYVLLLANAIHPHVGPAISNLRGEVASAAAQALGLYGSGQTPSATTNLRPLEVNPSPSAEGSTVFSRGTSPQDERRHLSCDRPIGVRTVSYTPAEPSSCAQGVRGASSARDPQPTHTLTGLDVLESTHFAALAQLKTGQNTLRLALLTNQTGRDAQGRRNVDILATDLPRTVPGARLTTLFSPEHGIFGRQDTEHLRTETDPATGLHVTSLYGAHDSDRRPSHEQLKDLDAVVIDLQDAGVRFFTYETVVGYFLEAAVREKSDFHHRLSIVLLDRPNPIGGLAVQGPVSDPGLESYTDYMPLPVRHGMTLGELARYIDGTKNLDADLIVIPMQGWQRGDFYDDTGLPWVNPSPNLRSQAAATLYPGIALLEMTNVSVGRGTGTPFELFGAGQTTGQSAWFRASEVASAMNARAIPGVRFEPGTTSVAEDANGYPFHGQTIETVRIVVTDRAQFDSPALGVELLGTLHGLYPAQFQLGKAMRLVANRATLEALTQGVDPRTIAAAWQTDTAAFEAKRRTYLLYPSP